MPALAAVGDFAAPAVDDVVAEIDVAPPLRGRICFGIARCGVEPRIAAVVARDEVVVERCVAAAPDAAVAVRRLLFVGRQTQALGEDAPLEREVAVAVERGAFVHAPAHRAVVEDHAGTALAFAGVLRRSGVEIVPEAETKEADDDVFGISDRQRPVLQADAVARGSLARNGDVASLPGVTPVVADVEFRRQRNDARNPEHHDLGPWLRQRPAQRPFGRHGVGVEQVGDVVNPAAAASRDVTPAALGTGKGRCPLPAGGKDFQ